MDIRAFSTVKPAVNQIEVEPFQVDAIAFMPADGVQAEAWAPFAGGGAEPPVPLR